MAKVELRFFQHLPDTRGKGLHREGFGDQGHAFVEKTSIQSCILGISRHKQYLQAGPSHASRVGQLPSVESWQAYVGHQEVDTLLTFQ
jgi:hypothetical protein